MASLPLILSGRVEHGKKIGSSINIPTANIVPREDINGLLYGVYYSRVFVDDNEYKSITNLGTKPTVKDEMTVNAESFIYDFDGDLYEKEIRVELIEFRRPEMKFESIEKLSETMHADLEAGKMFNIC